jgi:hypothetical protein
LAGLCAFSTRSFPPATTIMAFFALECINLH